jgi:hypothetical protein
MRRDDRDFRARVWLAMVAYLVAFWSAAAFYFWGKAFLG